MNAQTKEWCAYFALTLGCSLACWTFTALWWGLLTANVWAVISPTALVFLASSTLIGSIFRRWIRQSKGVSEALCLFSATFTNVLVFAALMSLPDLLTGNTSSLSLWPVIGVAQWWWILPLGVLSQQVMKEVDSFALAWRRHA